MRDCRRAVGGIVAGVLAVILAREMPAAHPFELEQLVVALVDDRDGAAFADVARDGGANCIEQLVIIRLSSSAVRMPRDAPLFLEAVTVRAEQFAMLAGGDEVSKA